MVYPIHLPSTSTPQPDWNSTLITIIGTYTPAFLPVQLSIGPHFPSTTLILTFPLPLPGSPLGRATITHSLASAKGIIVELEGIEDNVGVDGGGNAGRSMKERAEEVVRRGGCLSLPGWIWKTIQGKVGVGKA